MVLVLVLVLALLAGGGYVAAYAFAGDKVPRGSEIAGVEVGGLTRSQAVSRLQEQLGGRDRTPITVTVGDQTQEVTPQQAGLSFDYAGAVDAAGPGASWSPSRLWDYYTGGDDDLEAQVSVDPDRISATVAELGAGFGAEARDGTIRFVDGAPVVFDPVEGQGLDPEATRDALVEAFRTGSEASLSFTDVDPEIGDEELADALTTQAEPAVSGPVTLVLAGQEVTLAPADFTRVLRFVRADDSIALDVRAGMLARLVETAGGGDEAAPVDARVEIVSGAPRVVPAQPGTTFPRRQLANAFLKAVVRPAGERRAGVRGKDQAADFTTRDARQLGVREKVSEFTTTYPYAEYRNVNIGRAAELVDGTLLEPGETFSMNDIVGERTRENGFTEGTIISDGVFKEDLGGGVSQMATTTFNAMFFAGLQDVEHRPHSFYISRYPEGREATLVFPVLDLRFRNDTQYGVVVKSQVTPATTGSEGVVTVSMWSTKVWDVRSVTSDRYDFTPPATRRLTGPDCIPNSGSSGFTVDVTRVFRKAGREAVDRREGFNTVYTPADRVVCD